MIKTSKKLMNATFVKNIYIDSDIRVRDHASGNIEPQLIKIVILIFK